jgi:starch phosphorylase
METKRCWFAEKIADPECLPIAFFSAEYGLHHSLPFYAGGLGFLAGDYLKECSDLGVPLVAVGFMYPEGYFLQKIRTDGWQENPDEILDRDAAPITRVLNEKGEQLVIKVPFIDPPIHVAVWKVAIGRISLYLVDTDIDINDPWNRSIAYHLYIGDIEQRLRQEIVLGIGGSEILKTLGIKHSVLHLNEGHSAFALLERIRERVEEGMSFDTAAEQVRKTSVFTTHTPVTAGHDIFPFHLMDKYFSHYYPILGLSRESFLQLGVNPKETTAGFNMTAFALKMSSYRNGVSKKHGEVARRQERGGCPYRLYNEWDPCPYMDRTKD